MLSLSRVSKTYPGDVSALQDVNLEVPNGMFGLLGPNGAGKSTLMKTIAGLQKADDGSIHFNGKDVVADPFIIKKQLGFLPQDFGVYSGISAFDLMMHLERACQAQVAALAGGAQLVTPSHQVAQKVAAQFARPGRQAPANAWAALMRMLDREDPTYRE